MEMHQVRYFLAVAQTLNFTRAAEQCNVAQPSLTRAIKKLEDEFGGLLFHREGVRTHLTELGQIMVPYFESIYSVTASARAEAVAYRKMERAPLRLGVMSTISPARMAPFVIHVGQRIPKLDLQLREGPATGLVECMLAGELDIALLALPALPDKLHSQPLFTERYSIAFPSGHRYEALNAIPLSELDGEDYLQRLHCEFRYHFEALGLPRNWQVNTRYRSEHEEWIQAMILAGLGCAIMPEFSPLLPGLATRIIIEPEVIRTVSLVTVAGRRFSPTERAFVEATRRYLWSTLPGVPAAGSPLGVYADRQREQMPLDV